MTCPEGLTCPLDAISIEHTFVSISASPPRGLEVSKMDRDRLRDSFRQRPLSEVVDTLCEIEALRRAVHATELEAIADIDARQGWRADGCNSMVDWLCFRLSMTRRTAHEFLDAARATRSE